MSNQGYKGYKPSLYRKHHLKLGWLDEENHSHRTSWDDDLGPEYSIEMSSSGRGYFAI